MYRALIRRDSKYEGVFWFGVRTTGIFCRPTCRAKRPKPENVEYFPGSAQALHAGYRACRLCRPLAVAGESSPLVQRLLRLVEDSADGRVSDKELRTQGIAPATARRRFRLECEQTFQAYQRTWRMGRAQAAMCSGGSVIEVQQSHGYESASGFRAAFTRIFGVAPRGATRADALHAKRFVTPLGTMVGVADAEGLRLLEFTDRRGVERELARLRHRLGRVLIPGDNPVLAAVAKQLADYFAGRRRGFDLPLAPVGSEFQRSVWRGLQSIPPGCTCSYQELARRIGRPGAARAVGRANGANMLALVIPCHRVVRADGVAGGYSGGTWRKQRLLEHELRWRR